MCIIINLAYSLMDLDCSVKFLESALVQWLHNMFLLVMSSQIHKHSNISQGVTICQTKHSRYKNLIGVLN